MNPFAYVNSITFGKEDLMVDDLAKKDYQPFLVNRALSYFPDCIRFAAMINKMAYLDKKLQFHFLLNIIRPKKRYSPWAKKENLEAIELIKEYYGYNEIKARQALLILTEDQIDIIRSRLYKGGLKK
jgi:hypothetical protein